MHNPQQNYQPNHYQQAPPPQKKRNNVLWIVLGVLIGGPTLMLGGCAACVTLIGISASKNEMKTSNALTSSAPSSSIGTSSSAPVIAPKEAALGSIKLDYKWSTGGFGAVMEANFTIQNPSNYAVKDLEITCTHFANSGTEIDSNTRTIYETVPAKGKKVVKNFNMGFIHSQATSSSCKITDLEIAQ